MYTELTLFTFQDFAYWAVLEASDASKLGDSRLDGWRCRLRRRRCLSRQSLSSAFGDISSQLAFTRLAEGPAKGVPSLFSTDFPLLDGNDSSRRGLTFKSAYFLQFVPQLSHRIFVGSPLGAFHQVLDSRVRQAPQLPDLEDWLTIDPSSSDRPTRWPPLASTIFTYWRLTGFGRESIISRIRRFSSPSLELEAVS